IPMAMGLLGPAGESLPLQLDGEASAMEETRVLQLERGEQTFRFVNVPVAPVPALLRDFSAPVKLHFDYSAADLALLMQHDPDSFVRWQAAQQLGEIAILENVRRLAAGQALQLDTNLSAAFLTLLEDHDTDPALLAEALHLP